MSSTQSALHLRSSEPCSIQAVPNELLGEFFVWAIVSVTAVWPNLLVEGSIEETREAILGVLRHWRAVGLAYQSVWSYIEVAPHVHPLAVSRALSRVGASLLHIFVYSYDTRSSPLAPPISQTMLARTLQLLLPVASRWTTFSFVTQDAYLYDVLDELIPDSEEPELPQLHELAVKSLMPVFNTPFDVPEILARGQKGLPRLTSLALHRSALDPEECFTHLRQLELSDCPLGTTSICLASTLRSLPLLEHLHLRGRIVNYEDDDTFNFRLVMPMLSALILTDVRPTVMFKLFHAVTFPRLVQLVLDLHRFDEHDAYYMRQFIIMVTSGRYQWIKTLLVLEIHALDIWMFHTAEGRSSAFFSHFTKLHTLKLDFRALPAFYWEALFAGSDIVLPQLRHAVFYAMPIVNIQEFVLWRSRAAALESLVCFVHRSEIKEGRTSWIRSQVPFLGFLPLPT